jgi:hypothetical protein
MESGTFENEVGHLAKDLKHRATEGTELRGFVFLCELRAFVVQNLRLRKTNEGYLPNIGSGLKSGTFSGRVGQLAKSTTGPPG